MAVIVVMRHGERADVVNNTEGDNDTILTDRGVAQVKQTMQELAAILRHHGVELTKETVSISVSPFRRTLQTAKAAAVAMQTSFGFEHKLADVVIDPDLGEVFGPQRIKSPLPPPLLGYMDDMPTARLPQTKAAGIAGSLHPAAWGEDAPAAHGRFQRAFLRHASEVLAQGGVRLLVTHGDAVQALVAHVHPGRVVYDCSYLGFVVFGYTTNRRWQLIADSGVSTLSEGDDEAVSNVQLYVAPSATVMAQPYYHGSPSVVPIPVSPNAILPEGDELERTTSYPPSRHAWQSAVTTLRRLFLPVVPSFWTALSFEALKPQTLLPSLIFSFAIVLNVLASVVSLVRRRRAAVSGGSESEALVESPTRPTCDSARARLSSRASRFRILRSALGRSAVSVLAVLPSGLVALAADRDEAHALVEAPVWRKAAWYLQWVAVLFTQVAVAVFA
jgi:broad specificity phosphatase PhoE